MSRIGVLALQGGFGAHARALSDLGHLAIEVREEADLAGLDGLVLPGGESTAQLRLIERYQLAGPLNAFVASGRPVLATCAGLILAALRVTGPQQRSFGWIEATVSRNAWGRQVDSFEATTDWQGEGPILANCPTSISANGDRCHTLPQKPGPLPLVFIRAPRIVQIGAKVEVLATLAGEPILIRQGNLLGATFHPELTPDRRVHRTAFANKS